MLRTESPAGTMAAFCCRVCGADTAEPILPIGRHTIVRCSGCEILTTSPFQDAEARALVYTTAYYGGAGAARFRSRPAEAAMRWFRERRARALERRMGTLKGRRVLDVGCGRGYTLAALQRRGADVHGTQISSAAASVAAGLVGSDRVFQGELAEAAYPNEFFDCVTIWHVLEHVDEPVALLREVARVLKANGVVYVEVPNAGGWAARSFRGDWLAYDTPNHLYHFTPSTLSDAARRAGLRRTSETHFSLEYSPPTLLQTVLNAALGGDNLLFNTFAHSATDSGSHAGGTGRLALHLAAGAIFALPVFCASVALGAAGAGDTYGAYFEHA